MQQIQFDTVTIEDRTERGELIDTESDVRVLRTNHENRPDFRLHGDGTVDLISANRPDIVMGGFGQNGVVLD